MRKDHRGGYYSPAMNWTAGDSARGVHLGRVGRDVIGPAGDGVGLPGSEEPGGPVWVEMPFPVRIRVRDSAGASVEMESVLDRLSPTNLCLRLDERLVEGAGLHAVVRLSVEPGVEAAPALAVCGSVAHVRLLEDGTYATEVGFTRHWFLYAG